METQILTTKQLLTSKTIALAFLIGSIVFTYGLRTSAFYVNWVVGLLVLSVAGLSLAYKLKINKAFMFSWFLMSLWLPYVLLLTPLVYDKVTHLKYIIVSNFYITMCLVLVHILERNRPWLLGVIFFLNFLWVLVNIFLLILFLRGTPLYIDPDFSGVFPNRNQFAITTTVLLGLLLFHKKYLKGKLLKTSNLLVIGDIVLIISSGSVNGLIGASFLVSWYIWFNAQKWRKLLCICIVAVLLLGWIHRGNFAKYPRDSLMYRFVKLSLLFRSPEELRPNDSESIRLWFIREGLRITSAKPLTGVGVANSRYYMISPWTRSQILDKNQAVLGGTSHTNYIEMLLNGGIPGFLLYYIPVFCILFLSCKLPRNFDETFFLPAGLICKLLIDIAGVTYFDFAYTFLVALIFYRYFSINNMRNDYRFLAQRRPQVDQQAFSATNATI